LRTNWPLRTIAFQAEGRYGIYTKTNNTAAHECLSASSLALTLSIAARHQPIRRSIEMECPELALKFGSLDSLKI